MLACDLVSSRRYLCAGRVRLTTFRNGRSGGHCAALVALNWPLEGLQKLLIHLRTGTCALMMPRMRPAHKLICPTDRRDNFATGRQGQRAQVSRGGRRLAGGAQKARAPGPSGANGRPPGGRETIARQMSATSSREPPTPTSTCGMSLWNARPIRAPQAFPAACLAGRGQVRTRPAGAGISPLGQARRPLGCWRPAWTGSDGARLGCHFRPLSRRPRPARGMERDINCRCSFRLKRISTHTHTRAHTISV